VYIYDSLRFKVGMGGGGCWERLFFIIPLTKGSFLGSHTEKVGNTEPDFGSQGG
jgi:hypothetical protein